MATINKKANQALSAAGEAFAGALKVRLSIKPDQIERLARRVRGRRGIVNLETATKRAQDIPQSIRNTGQSGNWLEHVDNGHRRSVKANPDRVNHASNQAWEDRTLNRSTGSGRKPPGYWKEHNRAAVNKTTQRILRKAAVRQVGQAALMGAVIEAPLAILEETMAVRRGEKTAGEALRDGGLKVAGAGAMGAVGGGVAFAIGAAGFTVAAPVAVALGTCGAAAMAVGTTRRVLTALRPRRKVLALPPATALPAFQPELRASELDPCVLAGVG